MFFAHCTQTSPVDPSPYAVEGWGLHPLPCCLRLFRGRHGISALSAVGRLCGRKLLDIGVGGGIIIVPVLVFSFTLQGFDPSILTHLAVGTSLATIIFSPRSTRSAASGARERCAGRSLPG